MSPSEKGGAILPFQSAQLTTSIQLDEIITSVICNGISIAFSPYYKLSEDNQ